MPPLKPYKRKTLRTTAPKSKVKKLEKKVNKIIKMEEVKHLDYNLSQNVFDTGTLTLLSGMTQGSGETQRVGLKVYCKRIDTILQFTANSVATRPQTMTVWLILDKQGYNAPAITDILEPINLGSTLAPYSLYNWNYLNRFKVLAKRMATVDLNDKETKIITFGVNVNKIMTYIGAGTTFTNQIYFLTISDEANVLALPTVRCTNRITYTDD